MKIDLEKCTKFERGQVKGFGWRPFEKYCKNNCAEKDGCKNFKNKK